MSQKLNRFENVISENHIPEISRYNLKLFAQGRPTSITSNHSGNGKKEQKKKIQKI